MNARTLLVLALTASFAQAQTTLLVSRAQGEASGDDHSGVIKLSGDSRFVVFHSYATDLVVPTGTGVEDVFVRDLWTNGITRESLGHDGSPTDGDSRWGSLSTTGRHVAFQSAATNLVPGDTNGLADIFVRDRELGLLERASVGPGVAQSDGASRYPMISRDGRCVLFESVATNLVLGDTNASKDIFVRDLQLGVTTRVSVGTSGQEGDGDAGAPHLSPDGRFVAFESAASNLVPGDVPDVNGRIDVFVHDLVLHTTVLVSTSGAGVLGNGDSRAPYLTLDARFVTFRSAAANLVPGDTNGFEDVFVKDLASGQVQCVSVDGLENQGHWDAYYGSITPDGRYALFTSEDPALVPGDTNGLADLFLRDLVAGTTERVNLGFLGQQSNGGAGYPVLSDDARLVAFDSLASNLAAGDGNGARDVFVRDRWSSFQELCPGDGSLATPCPCGNSGLAGHGCENSSATGGALLVANGSTIPDAVCLEASGELSSSLTIFLQGNAASASGSVFGDGLRCVSGELLRLYVKNALGGAASAPAAGEASITQRSATLGAPIALGSLRWYQVYYRDAVGAFCPSATFNSSNASRVAW